MGLPRRKYVQEGQEEVYHCCTRCVRRAFLYGIDPLTHRDFSHRKAWILDRLKHLAAIFAIEVCAYAIMWNHYHTILRTRPDIAASWSDREVAIRWLKLFPKRQSNWEQDICALLRCPERIAELRSRLCSLSCFMGQLNEFIARAANKEDKVKGRFWESRFKCQVLLDEAAILAAMVYADLNLVRAGMAATPEESDFTSIQERIRAWQKENMMADSGPAQKDAVRMENAGEILKSGAESVPAPDDLLNPAQSPAAWLCPISSGAQGRGILQMTALEYFELVDKSGRIFRSDKRGAIDADLAPILLRIGANPDAWLETISGFEHKFCLAAGLLSNLRIFARRVGSRWLKGITAARTAFATSVPG